jgi:hypothetical protein
MTVELRDDFLVCTVHVTSDTICILHRTIQNSFDRIQFQTAVPLQRKTSGGNRYCGLRLLKHASMDSGTIGENIPFSVLILFSSSYSILVFSLLARLLTLLLSMAMIFLLYHSYSSLHPILLSPSLP